MLPKMLGLAFLMAGLSAYAGSSGFGSRADCVAGAGLQSPQGPLVLQQWLLEEHGGKGKEGRGQRRRALHQRLRSSPCWPGSKRSSASRSWTSLLLCRRRLNRCWKQTSSPNAMRVHQKQLSFRWLRHSNVKRLCRRKSRSWRKQLGTLPKQLTRPRRRPSSDRRRSTSCRQTTNGRRHDWYPPRNLLLTSTNPCGTLSKPFPPMARPRLSSHSWMQQSQAFRACWRRPRRHHPLRIAATMSTWRYSQTEPARAPLQKKKRSHGPGAGSQYANVPDAVCQHDPLCMQPAGCFQ